MNTKIFRNLFLLAGVSTLVITACQKNISGFIPDPDPVFAVTVSSSVSGFVTDENDAPVNGASVKAGSQTVITNQYGYFRISNANVAKDAGVVTVTRTGYFKGIKTYLAEEGKKAFFRIKLMPKTVAGTVSGSTGGSVTAAGGLKISFPANAVMTASSGAAYTGTVTVAARWIDPTAADLSVIMPGDLRGTNAAGAQKILTTYGMAAVELTGASGELLQIANGKKATMNFPLPATLLASAPATIPLWSFDENSGIWREEGSATKTGNEYVGDVAHFSFWNCDVPADYVQFSCTIKNPQGQPMPNVWVKIFVTANPANNRSGYTDSSGYVAGLVPSNTALTLEVYPAWQCTNNVFSQSFTTTNVPYAAGTIIVNNAAQMAQVSGSVTNCSNSPVTNGFLMVQNGIYGYYYVGLSNTGTFNFPSLTCGGTQNISITAEDVAGGQQSAPLNYTLAPGANNIPPIIACGISTQRFFNYSINGTVYTMTSPADSINLNPVWAGTNNPDMRLTAFPVPAGQERWVCFSGMGIANGSTQNLTGMRFPGIIDSAVITTPIGVHITEYGAVGQFVSGNYSGTVTGWPTPTVFNVSGSFRARRNF